MTRYYSSIQGRFTSADSYGGRVSNPQTQNLYSYVGNNPLTYIDPTGNSGQKICDQRCKDSREEADRLRKEAEEEGNQIVTVTRNHKKDEPAPDFQPTFDDNINELKVMQRHGEQGSNDEQIIAGAKTYLSWMNYKRTLPDFSPAYVQIEVDLPIKRLGSNTGLALQLAHDRNGNLYFGPGQYLGSPGVIFSIGWLKPNAPPSVIEDFIEQESTGGSVILPCLSNPFVGVGGGATYASGQISPQLMIGSPGVSYNITYGTKITNTGLNW